MSVVSSMDGETKTGQIKAKWAEDKFYPRVFLVTESENDWILPGDKVIVVAAAGSGEELSRRLA